MESSFSFLSSSNYNPTKGYCLITGASSGIGKAMAEEFAKNNHHLVLVALPNTGLEKVANDLNKKFNIPVLLINVDLIHKNSTKYIYDACEFNGVSINVLVNNAGFGNLELFNTTDPDELFSMMTLNNTSLVMLTRQFMTHLRRTSPSYILNTGSLASFFQIPYKAVYSATKSFVYSFSASLRLELQSENIYVSCLCPGGTLTSPRFREILSKSNGSGSRFLQNPEAVASAAFKGLFKKKFRIVPGIHNKIMLLLNDWLPERLISWILIRHFKPKKLSI